MSVERFRRYTTLIQEAASGASPLFDGWDLIPFADGLHHPEILQLMTHMETLGNRSLTGFSSDCWRIAHDPDWESLLDGLRQRQCRPFQITLYGMEETHDWFAGRQGSFAATSLAVDRVLAKGIGLWWGVLLHERNASEVDEVLRWTEEKAPGTRAQIQTISFSGRGEECADLALHPHSLALLSSEARSRIGRELRTDREWRQLAVENRFPRSRRWDRLSEVVLLLVSHDGHVASGVGGRIALGHLDENSVAELVERHDRLVLPTYDEARAKEEELLAAVVRSGEPGSEETLLTADNQLWVWRRMYRQEGAHTGANDGA
jgi:hypothetical protein